jgi:hypothetical protein
MPARPCASSPVRQAVTGLEAAREAVVPGSAMVPEKGSGLHPAPLVTLRAAGEASIAQSLPHLPAGAAPSKVVDQIAGAVRQPTRGNSAQGLATVIGRGAKFRVGPLTRKFSDSFRPTPLYGTLSREAPPTPTSKWSGSGCCSTGSAPAAQR